MPDEPLALSPIPPTVPVNGDYDAICAALRQSERGRRFLEEHARRNRNVHANTVIGAIEPVNAVIQGEHAQQAQTDVLAAVERLQDLAWTMREHGLDMATCEHIEILASTILSASWLRDPNDRRAQKLGEALGYLERRIDSTIAAAKERAREHAKAPFEEIAVPIEGALEPSRPDGVNEPSVESASVATPSEHSASGQMEPASIPSDSADAAALPVGPAADSNAREIGTEEATTVRVPTMWEPPPEPVAASPTQPLPDDWTADIENELFAGPALPIPQAAAPRPPSGAAGSAPIASTRGDPLAALKAMSDEEKIALFT
jgi:hypothetical protein